MTIESSDYTKQEGIYLYEEKLYRILSYCPEPSITMISLDGTDRKNFGIHGLMSRQFTLLSNFKYDHVNSRIIPKEDQDG